MEDCGGNNTHSLLGLGDNDGVGTVELVEEVELKGLVLDEGVGVAAVACVEEVSDVRVDACVDEVGDKDVPW